MYREKGVHKMNEKKYILITGTGFINKGSQAMLYTAVDELKKRFPDKEVIDLSTLDYKKDVAEEYSYKIMPDYLSLFIPKKYLSLRAFGRKIMNYKESEKEKQEREKWISKMEDIYRNAYFIVNAGGYALGSPIGRRKSAGSMAFMMRIAAAKELGVPIYLLPQSYGPFDYLPGHKFIVKYFMRKYMDYPRLVFAREKEGYECLKPYRKDRMYLCKDIVVTSKEIDWKNIYKDVEKSINVRKIEGEHPVAVIPNMMCFVNTDETKFLELYSKIINKLASSHDVYLLRHSREDIEGCQKIYDYLENKDRVHLLLDDMNCLELEKVLEQFEFCVASRFHSIVHSYKNGTPCVVLGWAAKYYDLLEGFEQKKYLFDVRKEIKSDDIVAAIDEMEKDFIKEKVVIQKCLEKQQAENAFDKIQEDINELYGG